MTSSAGGNPRFKGPGSLWKTSWRRTKTLPDMDFFTNFISPGQPLRSWYESSGVVGDAWFIGTATPGFVIGGVILLPTNFATATPVSVASRFKTAAPIEGWRILVTPTLHLEVSYALSDGSLVTLDGGAITPGVAWPFLIDIFDNGGAATGRLYIPIIGNLANIAATNTAGAGILFAPTTSLATTFRFGLAAGSTGGDNIHINGLTIGNSAGVPTLNVIAFFNFVKDNLTLPQLAVTNDANIDATLVFPDAPSPYVTITPPASGLTQNFLPGGAASILNVGLTVDFAY